MPGLEEVMRAATGGSAAAQGGGNASDPLGLIMRALPAFLESTRERDAIVDKQNEAIGELLKNMNFVRRQLKALVDSHKAVLKQLHQMREQQSAIVGHLARVQIIGTPGDAELAEGAEEAGVDEPVDDEMLAAALSYLAAQRRGPRAKGGAPQQPQQRNSKRS